MTDDESTGKTEDESTGKTEDESTEKVSLDAAFDSFEEQWSPRLAAELNGQAVKLAKLEGEFVWHHHDEADELFLVREGRLRIEFRDEEDRDDVTLDAGELLVVPAGVEHRPVADEGEAEVLLFEPSETRNTGNVESEETEEELERI
ncbi:cupin domain-containing protein [Halorussus gelatinilyticus]|uniref:Cupin domain-containing protein n=1 Tax=Halorussus gelatinilyticus TaxID=2937524 RepID=A0A8U0IL77_9EURY|nr:cupin domain-containing protein [Halorussus gelatinilyticus]UPW01880.1 cupin domain-containing protein [Halorussus gelatinilyticus]